MWPISLEKIRIYSLLLLSKNMLHHLIKNCSKFNGDLVARHVVQQKQTFARPWSTSSHESCYQYLHKSKLPTLYFQKSLPRLPIPGIEETMKRYLTAVEPILSAAAFNQAKATVAEFESGIGIELQALLKASDSKNKHTSYISQPWFDMYLSDRSPLPLNYNPLLVMKYDARAEYNEQLLRSTNLVISSLRFMRSLRANLLEPEVFHLNPKKSDTDRFRQITRLAPNAIATYVAYAFKAFPLDMSQYNRLFGVTRIPQLNKDRIYQSTDSRHILVMRSGKLYAIDVLSPDGNIDDQNVILGRLKAVIEINPSGETIEEPHLSVMTAANRDEWARTREHIINIGNAEQMQMIDSALFCLSLDGNNVKYNKKNPAELLKHFLAGDASNRWFDKSISLIVSGDGTAAVNFEHSWGDGVAVLRYFNEIYKETTEAPIVCPNTVPKMPSHGDSTVRSLDLKLDDRVHHDILKASKQHNATMSSLDMSILRFSDGINKSSCKRNGVSPDSIMQLAFQLAYRQAFGGFVGTYESCSTAAFRHGRTETMRPCTMSTKAFCESVLKSGGRDTDKAELRAMLTTCSDVHGNLLKNAAMGKGFDRHLFGLLHMAQLNGIEIPTLYKEEAYNKINYNIISTSTLSSPSVLAGAFGPVVRDGLGIGYSIQDNECGAVVTSYKGERDGNMFIDSLNSAFVKIRNIFNNNA